LQGLYGDLLSEGRSDGGGGLSARTVAYIHRTLKKSLSDAVAWGLIGINPASGLVPPRVQQEERVVWTPRELGVFLGSVIDDELELAWWLLATTGMRRGEVLGLRWSDIDLDLGLLTVSRAAVVVRHEVTSSPPKTRRSRRIVPIDSQIQHVVRRHRARQAEHRLRGVWPVPDSDLVFTWPDGRTIHPTWLTKRFTKVASRAGLPRIRLHDLRHSFATAALAAGVQPRIVSDLLGHSTVAFTLDTYGHALPGSHLDAITRVAEAITSPA
jgi:integrase